MTFLRPSFFDKPFGAWRFGLQVSWPVVISTIICTFGLRTILRVLQGESGLAGDALGHSCSLSTIILSFKERAGASGQLLSCGNQDLNCLIWLWLVLTYRSNSACKGGGGFNCVVNHVGCRSMPHARHKFLWPVDQLL